MSSTVTSNNGPQPPWLEPAWDRTSHLQMDQRVEIEQRRQVKLNLLRHMMEIAPPQLSLGLQPYLHHFMFDWGSKLTFWRRSLCAKWMSDWKFQAFCSTALIYIPWHSAPISLYTTLNIYGHFWPDAWCIQAWARACFGASRRLAIRHRRTSQRSTSCWELWLGGPCARFQVSLFPENKGVKIWTPYFVVGSLIMCFRFHVCKNSGSGFSAFFCGQPVRFILAGLCRVQGPVLGERVLLDVRRTFS